MQAHIRAFPLRASAAIKWLIVVVSFIAAAVAFYTPPYTVYRPEQTAFAAQSQSRQSASKGDDRAVASFSKRTRARLVRSMEHLDHQRPASHTEGNRHAKASGSAVNVTGIRG
jgi:hypothetical protein